MDVDGLAHLLRLQDGVVARRQLTTLGARPHEIRRLLRRRELNRIHPGVYIDHTGPPTWQQRAWAAVLVYWPAALARQSALPKPEHRGPVHAAIADDRTVVAVPGVVAHRTSHLDQRVRWTASPPRIRLEHAVIDVALESGDLAQRFQVFAQACGTRQTTASLIAGALQARARVPDKRLLLELLDDLACGACSVLEREYLLIERRHGLPCGQRQRAARLSGRTVYRDVPYEEYGVVVELDGRGFHDNPSARDRDFERDLDTAVDSDAITIRLSYGQVFSRGCRTIQRIAQLLRRRGWSDTVRACPACPVP